MKNFNIYSHPTLGYQAVKVGFCWPAFFFSWFWALLSKLWSHAIVILIFIFCLGIMSFTVKSAGGEFVLLTIVAELLLQTILVIYVGKSGNEWRAKKLEGRGYKKVATVQADNKDAAISLHVEGQPKPA